MFENYLSEYGASVVGGAVFLAVAWIFAVWMDRIARHLMTRSGKLDDSLAVVLSRTLRITICVLAGIAVLEELGVEIASLIAALGIFGFALALGLRTTTNNFFTGVMLFALKPYKPGDFVEGERVEGVVESLGMFHTVVITEDGTYVAIPNGAMWQRSVKNFSRPRPRRINLEISVSRAKPFEELSPVIENTLKAEAALAAQFPPLLRIHQVTEEKMVLRIDAWCDTAMAYDATNRLTAALETALTDAGTTVNSVKKVRKRAARKKTPAAAPPPSDDVV